MALAPILKVEVSPMIVCLCKAVNDAQLVEIIKGGASTVKQVADTCGAGAGCGACNKEIHDMIEDEAAFSSDPDAA